jgi:hypothetical protein
MIPGGQSGNPRLDQIRRTADIRSDISPLMDPISISFYAVVCGLLGLVSPAMGSYLPRLGVGAIVGIVAAILLPYLRQMVTGY